MAEQTSQLSDANYTVNINGYNGWIFHANTPLIDEDLSPAGQTRRLFVLLFDDFGNGRYRVGFTEDLNPGTSDATGQDLSDLFEAQGTFSVVFGGVTYQFTLDGADTSEPYDKENEPDSTALSTALVAASTRDASVTFRDFVPAAPSFADDTGDDQSWTVGTAITPIQVPEADGDPAPTYAVVGSLPADIVFDPATRIISGTFTGLQPAASAPTVTIAAVSSVDEDDTLDLSASVSGGTYDALTYLWTIVSGGGSLSGATTATPTYTPPSVSSDTDVEVRCTVTATGDGTNAESGTSDEASDTETFTVSTTDTTVSASAGPNRTVASGGTTTLAGSASVSNGVGSTTYSWARVSGTGGSLNNSNIAAPTFTAPTVTANRSIVYRLTATNNGVSDTDLVTISVTAPVTPDTTVSASAGPTEL